MGASAPGRRAVVAFPARATALAASGRRSYRRQPIELDAQFFVDGTQDRRLNGFAGREPHGVAAEAAVPRD
jgi:hypothetical protein